MSRGGLAKAWAATAYGGGSDALPGPCQARAPACASGCLLSYPSCPQDSLTLQYSEPVCNRTSLFRPRLAVNVVPCNSTL